MLSMRVARGFGNRLCGAFLLGVFMGAEYFDSFLFFLFLLFFLFFHTTLLHRDCTNSRCMSYDKRDEAWWSSGSAPSGAVQYHTAFMNWSWTLTRVLTRIIPGCGTGGGLMKAAVFLSLGRLHLLHEYFHKPCVHMRFLLQCMQAFGFLPCSHPPVQATHLRRSLLCSHCKCGLQYLQLELLLRPWGHTLVFVLSIFASGDFDARGVESRIRGSGLEICLRGFMGIF